MPTWAKVTLIIALTFIGVCGLLTIVSLLTGATDKKADGPVLVTVEPSSTASADASRAAEAIERSKADVKRTTQATTPPVRKEITIDDGTYHVGEDIQPGTYRLREAVTSGSFCYWRKSTDAEGQDIVDNDLASTGRLQVTLKTGQWFTSNRCGTWVKK